MRHPKGEGIAHWYLDMKTTVLHRPGSLLGCCKTDCHHQACASAKSEAATLCCHCAAPIGYNRPFYHDGNARRAHTLCTAVGPVARAAIRESLGLPL